MVQPVKQHGHILHPREKEMFSLLVCLTEEKNALLGSTQSREEIVQNLANKLSFKISPQVLEDYANKNIAHNPPY